MRPQPLQTPSPIITSGPVGSTVLTKHIDLQFYELIIIKFGDNAPGATAFTINYTEAPT
jgi:hypothetical protein